MLGIDGLFGQALIISPAGAITASGDVSVAGKRTMAFQGRRAGKRSSRRPWKAIVQILLAQSRGAALVELTSLNCHLIAGNYAIIEFRHGRYQDTTVLLDLAVHTRRPSLRWKSRSTDRESCHLNLRQRLEVIHYD